jgi:RimJ/RimL family protein N-acetyltransferase
VGVPSGALGSRFAFEAVTAVIAWASAQTADQRVIAVIQAANTRSCTLAKRFGMTREETFEEYVAEQVQFALARPEVSGPEPAPPACE